MAWLRGWVLLRVVVWWSALLLPLAAVAGMVAGVGVQLVVVVLLLLPLSMLWSVRCRSRRGGGGATIVLGPRFSGGLYTDAGPALHACKEKLVYSFMVSILVRGACLNEADVAALWVGNGRNIFPLFSPSSSFSSFLSPPHPVAQQHYGAHPRTYISYGGGRNGSGRRNVTSIGRGGEA